MDALVSTDGESGNIEAAVAAHDDVIRPALLGKAELLSMEDQSSLHSVAAAIEAVADHPIARLGPKVELNIGIKTARPDGNPHGFDRRTPNLD